MWVTNKQGGQMKRVRTEWKDVGKYTGVDSVLSIKSADTGVEIAELRRSSSGYGRNDYHDCPHRYGKTSWQFRPTHPSNDTLVEHLGEQWFYETLHGFSRIKDFQDWIVRLECF